MYASLLVLRGVVSFLGRYGALMWSLGKVLATPEVLRVYIGSFWDQPLKTSEQKALFDAESNDLLADLRSLPRNSAVRKVCTGVPSYLDVASFVLSDSFSLLSVCRFFCICLRILWWRYFVCLLLCCQINELVKRARMAKVHAYLLSTLRGRACSGFRTCCCCSSVFLCGPPFLCCADQFGWFGKEKTQKKLLNSLAEEFRKVQRLYNLPKGDFPNLRKFKEKLQDYEISKFPRVDPGMIEAMDQVLAVGTCTWRHRSDRHY